MDVKFKWIGGATFILSIGDIKIAVDPVLCKKGTVQDYFWFKSKRIEAPVYTNEDFENIDLWLITHNHEDHLDTIGLSKITTKDKVITNGNSYKKLKKRSAEVTVLKWKETKDYKLKNYDIKVEAIPAIHGVNPLSAFFAGKVNAYYISISKGQETIQIYITGDTVYKTKVIDSLKTKKIDLMLPNMGAAKQGTWIMTLTLNAKMLKQFISKLNPSIVIPIHYGTFEHYHEPVEKIEALHDARIKIVAVGSETIYTI